MSRYGSGPQLIGKSLGSKPSFEESRSLRLFSILLLYVVQGFPIGLSLFAIPVWLTANGATTADIAFILSLTTLPWSIKLLSGFIIDRYTFLAMGRRRAWILGAQASMIIGLCIYAIIQPTTDDIMLLASFGFLLNVATAFLDVAVDGLIVDIMPAEERARASGMMYGGQAIGMSAGIAVTGAAIVSFGFSGASLSVAAILIPTSIFVAGIRERPGERLLPWSEGHASTANYEFQADRWFPIITTVLRSLTQIASVFWIPILLLRGISFGILVGMTPLLAVSVAGWTEIGTTSVTGSAQLVAGLIGLAVGGYFADRIGAKRTTLLLFLFVIVSCLAVLTLQSSWSTTTFVSSFIFGWVIINVLISIAMVPISIRLCSRMVAATQFTVYMTIINLGIFIGVSVLGWLDKLGGINAMIMCLVGVNMIAACLLLMVRLPDETS